MPARREKTENPRVAVAPQGHSSVHAQPPSLESALDHHQAGELQLAEKSYRAILSKSPNHADALHLLGMLLHNCGDNDQAERLIRRAISVQPGQPVFHSNLGIVLSAKGKGAEAIAAYRSADSLQPDSPETLNNLGVALHASGSVSDAVECFKRAFTLNPDYTDARNNFLAVSNLQPETAAAYHGLGDLLHQADRSADAIGFYRKAIELHPESAETHSNLGNALFAIGEVAEALLNYQKALELKQDFPQGWNNLGNALKEFGRLDEAMTAYRRSMLLQPNSPEPISNLGSALREAGEWEWAMECYQLALSFQPDHFVTHNNIGNAFCERGDWPAAIAAYERALSINPDYADAINNLGTALEEIGQRDRAMQCYLRAQELTPKAVSPPWNIALLQLLQGDYENGWPGYENRWRQKKQGKTRRNFKQPMLKDVGQIKGSKILLYAEQGFGDAIQFSRYASLVAQQGAAAVFLECPPKLVRLFTTLPGITTVIPQGESLPDFDLHCPLMSLPMVFDTDRKTGTGTVFFPENRNGPKNRDGDGFYLSADAGDIALWREKFAGEPAGFRVGIVWAGAASHQKDRHRSVPLAALEPLAQISGIRFYSLQVGEAAAQAKSPPAGMHLTDWTDQLEDFADTAALISQLDLVITVDTSVCHLTGALGKPVWLLLAFHPDWRWLLDREDSPWYPTARLFRQPEPGNWNDPIARAAQCLAAKMGSIKNPATGFEATVEV